MSRAKSRKSRDQAEEDDSNNFKVVIRVRPPLPREQKDFVNVVKVDPDTKAITISENLEQIQKGENDGLYTTHVFTFDHVYDANATQLAVYNNTAKEAVLSLLQGYNATLIAYGQTGTGKTYTMEGFFRNESQRGIIPRATEEIFEYIKNCPDTNRKFLVRASYLQIYNEVISDLLKPERTNLTIREDKKKGVYVEQLSEWVVRSPQEIYGLMERGAQRRATGSTRMNELSSRSHAVFIIIVEQSVPEGDDCQSFKIGKLNLVDLAGSERVRFSGATGQRLQESKKINQSLSALGNVIAALTSKDRSRKHIPYRDSKLTRLLEDSLGGNCKTTMMAMIGPALESFHESISTLKFANRAKHIKNKATINEDLDQRALLRKYERELKILRQELAERKKSVVDKQKLLELEEQKRRAEEDKIAAITALEKRSREFLKEKAEKRKLEEKISMMQSQFLTGGQRIEDTPEFRKLASRVHKEYETKLAELEQERQSIEEDKAQVDRYKQLLLKQRDIMIALTARLNERDETILALQEELDAYDRHQKMLEDALDRKTTALIQLQKIAGHNASLSSVKLSDDYIQTQPEKKYPPHEDHQVVFGSYTNDHTLLNADEKICELSKLLEKSKEEHSKLSKELEEIKAEKVSLEYLLREKLEKMVQSEIEEKINIYKNEVEKWKLKSEMEKAKEDTKRRELNNLWKQNQILHEENKRLQEKINTLHRMLQQKVSHNASTLQKSISESSLHNSPNINTNDQKENISASAKLQINQLRHQCITKEKEKQALKTILEQKIGSMVENVYQKVCVLEKEPNKDIIRDAKKVLITLSHFIAATGNAITPQPTKLNKTIV